MLQCLLLSLYNINADFKLESVSVRLPSIPIESLDRLINQYLLPDRRVFASAVRYRTACDKNQQASPGIPTRFRVVYGRDLRSIALRTEVDHDNTSPQAVNLNMIGRKQTFFCRHIPFPHLIINRIAIVNNPLTCEADLRTEWSNIERPKKWLGLTKLKLNKLLHWDLL